MERNNHRRAERAAKRRGGALLLAILATVVLASLAGALLAVTGAFRQEHVVATGEARALYVAEASLSDGIAAVRAGGLKGIPAFSWGDPDPVPFGDGTYWGSAVAGVDHVATVTGVATVAGRSRALEAVLEDQSEGVYTSALFAGNSSGDPLYDMDFGGLGKQADAINGNVYSGGNVTVKGDAKLNGAVKATGTITGFTGGKAGSAPIPDIPAMNYPVNNDYNVASLFSGATYKSSSGLGGSAWQVKEENPAHIFRKNPSDRSTDTSKTVKDDYFLEDPYESVSTSSTVAAKYGTHLTLAGQDGNPGKSGTNKVYYIDGNLWIHNKNIFSFTLFNSKAEPAAATFVVSGNIYFSDNIFYNNAEKDGIAFIAMKDSKVKDSGNVYFGDPTFGTLEHMDAFMYAENNFYDNNLSASGSATVTVNGNMTAGNQVLINRDYGSQHSKLTVNFDDRLATGDLRLPGLPTATGGDALWVMRSWREVPVP
jgi:hypothetical protein